MEKGEQFPKADFLQQKEVRPSSSQQHFSNYGSVPITRAQKQGRVHDQDVFKIGWKGIGWVGWDRME